MSNLSTPDGSYLFATRARQGVGGVKVSLCKGATEPKLGIQES